MKKQIAGEMNMRYPFVKIATSCVLALAFVGSAALAQAQAAKGSVVVASPTYASVVMEITINRPVADVWKRVGKYCDVSEWLQAPAPCKMLSGKDGEVGAVRSPGNGEVLVARTEYSYTYTQTPKEGTPYNLYHGTIEARPASATTTKIIYTLFFDNSMLADDAARAADKEARRARFSKALENMKILAEGGTLPPPPAAK